jgi:hypothetical protein
MFTNRLFCLLIVIALLAVTGCASVTTSLTTTAESTQQPATTSSLALVGTWTSTITKEDLLRVELPLPQEYLCGNAGTFVWNFSADGTWAMDQTSLPGCNDSSIKHVEDTWFLSGDLITFEKGALDQQIYEITIDNDQLTFDVKSSECLPCIAVFTANPWTRVE